MSTDDPFKLLAEMAEERKSMRESLSTYDAHSKSFKNFEAVKRSKKCGCFYCEKIFDADEVVDFVTERDGDKTAICPYCGVDSVIQDADVEITSDLLAKMYAEWFG